MTVASDEASGRSAAAAPVSARSCSWSPPPLLATTKAWVTSVTGCSQPERKKWSFVSRSPENSSSASTQKHATRVPNTPMQLDKPDSRSPGLLRNPTSPRKRGEVEKEPPLFRGAELVGEAAIAATQRAVVVAAVGIVVVANEVGDRRIAQHAPAIGQRRANETQHLPVGKINVDRRGIAGPDHFGALGDERVQLVFRQLPGT